MSHTDVPSWSATDSANTDAAGFDISEGCSPGNINDALRAIMGAVARWSQAQIGTVLPYAGTACPSYWLPCDGRAVSRSTYALLFAAVGTTYGAGDGSSTFNLPDYRGRAVVAADAMFGGSSAGVLASATLAAKIGEATHALTQGELASHNHGVTDSGHTHTDSGHTHTITDPGHYHTIPGDIPASSGLFNSIAANHGISDYYKTNSDSASTGIAVNSGAASIASAATGIATQNTGSGTGHNNVQPSLAVNVIIYAGA